MRRRAMTRARSTPATQTFGALSVVLVLWLLPSGVQPGERQDDVESTRAALEKMVEVKKLASLEKSEWTTGRGLLEDRIDLLRREIERLRASIREAQEGIAETDEARGELARENEALGEATAALQEIVSELETRTKGLVARLPQPLLEEIEPLVQRFPKDADDADASLPDRFLNVIGVLNAVNKFNQQISLASEVLTLPDGTVAEVTSLYVGIGQAYYATTRGDAAGVGTASADGWTWSPANEHVAEISRAISIMRDRATAEFVRLPIRIQ